MNSNILRICTPLSPAIDISCVIEEYVYICGEHFVNTVVFYHNFITVTKNKIGLGCL